MKPAIIAAMGSNREIGLRADLPWRLPADLRHFKRMTLGHHLIMGRKTYDSVGRPLPGRTTIVVTRQADLEIEGVLIAHSVEDALRLVRNDDEPFIAGGAEIYRQSLPLAHIMYLTVIHDEFEADTFFPEFDPEEWVLTERRDFEPNQENEYSYSFLTYQKKGS